jgi:hypothetical protein
MSQTRQHRDGISLGVGQDFHRAYLLKSLL